MHWPPYPAPQPAICQVGINVLQAFANSTRYPFLKDAACRIIRNVRCSARCSRARVCSGDHALNCDVMTMGAVHVGRCRSTPATAPSSTQVSCPKRQTSSTMTFWQPFGMRMPPSTSWHDRARASDVRTALSRLRGRWFRLPSLWLLGLGCQNVMLLVTSWSTCCMLTLASSNHAL